MNIDFDTFKSLASHGNLIPLYKEILGDAETPVSAFLKLKKTPSFLFESVVGGEKWARYSFLGIAPSFTVSFRDRKFQMTGDTERFNISVTSGETDDPLALIRDVMSRFKPVNVKGLPRFSGGLVGYIGYDVVRFFEKLPDTNKPLLDMPDIFLMLSDTILVFDNLRQTIKVVFNVHIDGIDIKDAYDEAEKKINEIIDELKKGSDTAAIHLVKEPLTKRDAPFYDSKGFASNFKKDDFLSAVTKTKEYIAAGDIFQAVPSQRFERTTTSDPFDIYRSLRIINPSPYMYYLDMGGAQIAGSSPEILVRLEDDLITLRPIAGTRKRGGTEDADKQLEDELMKDPKEIAEHIMLVDLGRNDVGRVAEIGSVTVNELKTVERYSHVMHIVSNVTGRLKRGLDAFDVLSASFPAGTVTGAPKIRAMEIIEELEPTKRGIYAGSIGYFGYSGNMDMCIAIRTLIIKDGVVYVQAGCGVVADSVPENEYVETLNKAMAMMNAVDMAERLG
ncbi:MAG: anthranilate synthase component I [Nitrospirae bacterium]|nr:anthranilate synthase component I [Nitrospirota bacterium]